MVIPCYPSIPPGSGFSCPAPARLGPWPQDQKLSEQSALKPPWPHCNKRPTRLRRIYTWSLMSLMSLSRQSFKSFSLAFLDCGDTAKTTGQKEWLKVWPGLCCSIAAAACQPGEISCGTFPHVWEQNCRNQITSGFSIRSPYFLWLSILEMTIKPYQPPLNPTPHQPIINPRTNSSTNNGWTQPPGPVICILVARACQPCSGARSLFSNWKQQTKTDWNWYLVLAIS